MGRNLALRGNDSCYLQLLLLLLLLLLLVFIFLFLYIHIEKKTTKFVKEKKNEIKRKKTQT